MKKLYFLNEEEKNRILNLHESRTKKQYLINEQRFTDGREKYVKFFNCEKAKNKDINDTLNDPKYSIGDWYNKLRTTKTYEEFCTIVRSYKKFKKQDLFTRLDSWISSGYWNSYIEQPLNSVTKDFNKNYYVESTNTGVKSKWEKYLCILNHTNALDYNTNQKANSESDWIKIGNFIYNSNGKKWELDSAGSRLDTAYPVYTCETEQPYLDEMLSKLNTNYYDQSKSTTNTGAVSGSQGTGGGNLTTRVQSVQTILNSGNSGQMDQATINALMAKLNSLGGKPGSPKNITP
jgi:hypothetical protein